MSSIMRARSGLTWRSERLESIRGSSLEPKVTGPSMLGIGCPDRHALPLTASPITHGGDARPPARAGSFFAPNQTSAKRESDLAAADIDNVAGNAFADPW